MGTPGASVDLGEKLVAARREVASLRAQLAQARARAESQQQAEPHSRAASLACTERSAVALTRLGSRSPSGQLLGSGPQARQVRQIQEAVEQLLSDNEKMAAATLQLHERELAHERELQVCRAHTVLL